VYPIGQRSRVKDGSGLFREERSECLRMHEIIAKYGLQGQLRWLVAQKNRMRNGELYRYIADHRGGQGFIVSQQIASVSKGGAHLLRVDTTHNLSQGGAHL
jgi:hypothetical protein